MKELKAIKNYFTPIQPSVRWNDNLISYKEFTPAKKIENFIHCYWELRTKKLLPKSYVYRVVSDGCIDIFFEPERPSSSFIMGFCRRYTEFELGQSFNYFGIRFLPSFFPLLFNIDAKDLSNTSQELKTILPEISNQISDITRDHDLVSQCNAVLAEVLDQQELNIDSRFYEALSEILLKHGNVDVETQLSTGLSPRQLRRKFNYYLGTTPKAFANVVRFQYILNAKPSMQSLKENKIYYDVGFFDQAHFIKSFKTFYGVTPSVAFQG